MFKDIKGWVKVMERIEMMNGLIEELNKKFSGKYEFESLFDGGSFWIKENDKIKVHVSMSVGCQKIAYFPEDIPLSEMVDDDVKDAIRLWAEEKELNFVDMHNVYLNRLALMRTVKGE